VIDYRKLNASIDFDFKPLTDSQAVFQQAAEVKPKYFSCSDWVSGYHQLRISEESQPITAFSNRSNQYMFKKLPQCLTCSPILFMTALYTHLAEMQNMNVELNMDDFLAFHPTLEQHLQFLKTIFEKLRVLRLRLNPKKSLFCCPSVTFLGFKFTSEGMEVDPKRFEKIRNLKPATNVKEMKMLIGFMSFYRKHVSRFAIIVEPLRSLLRKDTPFVWGSAQDQALQKIKDILLQNITLQFPDMNATFYIQTDASHYAIAHSLLQKKDGMLKIVSTGGRTLRPEEKKLCATDLELMGILHALESYKQFIANGNDLVLLTDHCSLQFIQNLKYASSPKLIRYSLMLQQFRFQIKHIKGKDNVLPDFLSRYPMVEETETEDQQKPEPNSLFDIDHYSFLNAIQVEQIAEENGIKSDENISQAGDITLFVRFCLFLNARN
jgi:RNase H-like domain found in reverse transcriptase/Reverse transcriptase (RNA-dependent DNA polymerase)